MPVRALPTVTTLDAKSDVVVSTAGGIDAKIPFEKLPVQPLVQALIDGLQQQIDDFDGGGGGSTIDLKTDYSIDSPANYDSVTLQQRMQDAIESLKLFGGTVLLAAGTYVVSNLTLYNNVCLAGVSSSATTIQQATGAVGPLITSFPLVGTSSSVRGKHIIRDLLLDGALVGVYKASCTMTAGSAVLTAVTNFTGIANGVVLEGMGLPNGTKVQSFNAGAGTITATNAVTNSAPFTATGQLIVWRPTINLTATATNGSPVLNVTGGDMSGVVAGEMCRGDNLDTDADDLSDASRVKSVNVGAQTITMDRPAKVTGSFALDVYISNDGILCPEPYYNDSYNPSLEYRAPKCSGIQILNFSGYGFNARSNRDQVVFESECKILGCYQDNFRLQGSNDSKVMGPIGIGSAFKCNLSINSSSTFRIINFDIFEPKMPDKYANIALRGLKECTIAHGDCNGWMDIKGKGSAEPNHGIRIENVNFKWHDNDGYPDHSFPQYVSVTKANGTVVSNCLFKTPDTRVPDRIFELDDTILHWEGSNIVTNIADSAKTYAVELYHTSNGAKLIGSYFDITAGLLVKLGQETTSDSELYQLRTTDRRTASEGGNRNINVQSVDQRIAVTSALAAYSVTLPYITSGSKRQRIRFAVDGGSIAALTWKITKADGTVETVSSTNFDSVTWQDLPKAVYGTLTVDVWFAETTLKWEFVALNGRGNPAVTVPYSATITLDADTGSNFYLTLTGNSKLENPNNMEEGEIIVLNTITTGAFSFTTIGTKIIIAGGLGAHALTSSGKDRLTIQRLVGEDKFRVEFAHDFKP